MPFIRAISNASPTSKLNVTFLQTSAGKPFKDETSNQGTRPTTYNSRNVGICVMLAGSIPVRRFSPNNLPGRHQCQAEAAAIDRAWERTNWQ